jgi:hypothetical protein
MVLPGQTAIGVRIQFAVIIRKHLGGDQTLHAEIDANAASNSPIAQLARAGVESSIEEDHEARRKRAKREDLELVNLEHEIQERRIRNLQNAMGLMAQIRPDWMQADARFRLQTEDLIKNIITVPSVSNHDSNVLGITDAARPASLSISQLSQELGCKRLSHSDVCRVGAKAKRLYQEQYKTDPPKHPQWVDGAERSVNSYTEAHRGLLTEALDWCGLLQEASSESD